MTQRLFCTDDPQGVNQRRNQSNPGVRFEICPEQPIQYQSQQMGEVRNNNQRNGDLRTPCTSLYNDFIEEDGAQIVDIAPCPDPQFHRGPTVTLNVVPLNQQFRGIIYWQVTEGKIYVEVERARLTHKLAKIREDDGDIQQAADIIQELQVETYGSMEKREKVELILEQMRLCVAKQDYIRTQIISKKINTKFFDED
uniref:Uncharacterized protein LOC114335245 n=1 Tax=Diabrotica virgifera virgifera TaxID=50390 RepID=A0A6P7FXG7_DIAVI